MFGTIQQQFLVEITGDERHPARHPVSSLEELNGLLDAWVRTVYHARVHSETGETPQARYQAAGPASVPDPAPTAARVRVERGPAGPQDSDCRP